MDYKYYLEKFRKSADRIDKKMLSEKHLEIHVGITLNAVVLKLYKTEWVNDKTDPINSKTRIFFAIWVNDETLKQKKVLYNIHALKLRGLKGYAIKSRAFADCFREDFIRFKQNWENVSVEFGPLTLIEGWEHFESAELENKIVKLANNFSSIAYLIDNTLKKFELTKIY
ncbi:MAG: hypothetical protein H6574_07720 [Lewinellaceae bacterium]|nr:hypothetical protein [Saprospiraceae bacterium]MCB9330952.1 hypothetical protein [Lewinellaceae bacterium]